MALRTITKEGDPILRKVCRPVTEFNERLWTVLDDMAETMHHADGVGLAGPQVSYLRRVVVIDVGEGVIEMINPEIVEVSKETQYCREGCLSVPGKWGMTTRPLKIKAKAQDRNGNWFEVEGEQLLAQAICHELEHLDGKLFIDIVEEWLKPEDLEEQDDRK
ncbi:MAG: peptide deformylase [Ruminococcus sp.]|nr:peptide deformylase [Ruminococcus sp.]